MTVVTFEGKAYTAKEGETVLDTLLRGGNIVPYGCRGGVCQACMLGADNTTESVKRAQGGLSNTQKALNYFLACQCLPTADLAVKNIKSSSNQATATVIDKVMLNDYVIRLRLDAELSYRPGQYVNLSRDAKLLRSYSLASTPNEGFLEFHIRHYPEGQFSTWAAADLSVGDTLELQGPLGDCIYVAEPEQPLLLLGTGTGLAPLWGIVKDALSRGHTGPIHLVLAGRSNDELYYQEELRALAAENDQVSVSWVVQEGMAENDTHVGDVYQYCKAQYPALGGYKVYLCGAKTFVTKLKKQCFLSGAGVRDIVSDIFLSADNPLL